MSDELVNVDMNVISLSIIISTLVTVNQTGKKQISDAAIFGNLEILKSVLFLLPLIPTQSLFQ